MSRSNLIWGFILRFLVIYGVLIIPWPYWPATYGEAIQWAGNAIFANNQNDRFVRFEPHRQTQGLASLDTRIILGNRHFADSSGKGPAELLGFDTRSICWTPTALTIALILATPIPWKRRLWASIGGLILVHMFILFSVWLYLWNESTKVNLITLSPFWKQVADGFEYTFITQMGVSFTVPVLIWIAVAFRWREESALSASHVRLHQ